ncbi:Uterine Lumin Expressed/locailized [Caenorhabditis elegans]|uniref:Uterine Lumin Expressed/locailized n=1 Tax=Caenorhabditis elegans TaxID=6239 RepID=Q18947_CAEEL|nr:Uterine Lumin Expressed/locailized [Caenorhabditis elegans]CAA98439.1 Uterine Lumin Expressed/locailized [Caenorhabditis elegans]|eukprot:NP_505759.1 Uterine Lumin Expressed/locailized [Caenorhabditis elegans]
MLVVLAISLAVTAVCAQYGSGPANNPPASSYSSNVYYPPPVYGSVYWDYDSGSREHRHKQCPRLRAYVGEFPGIPEEAFYPPIIRYVKYNRKVTALVVCDRDEKNLNFLFARHNKTRDVRSASVVAIGSTAGVTLVCNRDDRRYEGFVIDMNATTNGFSKKIEITQLTCLGLDKTIIGLPVEHGVQQLAQKIQEILEDDFFVPVIPSRRKRQAGGATANSAESTTEAADTESTTEAAATETPAAESTTTEASATDAAATEASATDAAATEGAVTKAAAGVTEESATEVITVATTPASPDAALNNAINELGKILGQVF